MKRILNHPWFLWLILAIPSIPIMIRLINGERLERLLHPSGEFAARFMIIAMMLSPLLLLCKTMKWKTGWVLWLIQRRRAFGVAAFAYALLHTIFYLVDMEAIQAILAEFWEFGVWTGWLAFFIFVPLALTSNQASVLALGSKWKTLQRAVYIAAVATLLHWIFIHRHPIPALANFFPLACLELFRINYWYRQRKQSTRNLAE